MPRYQSDEHRILLSGRRMSANGGFVSRSHLRQSVGGLGADVVDAVLAKHRILPQTFPTQMRGRPITVYKWEDFDRACKEINASDEIDNTTGYAAALKAMAPAEFDRLSLRVLRSAKDLAEPVGFIIRTRLKSRYNVLPAEDLTFLMNANGVPTVMRGQSQAYELDKIVEAIDRLESQVREAELERVVDDSPAATEVSNAVERLKDEDKPW